MKKWKSEIGYGQCAHAYAQMKRAFWGEVKSVLTSAWSVKKSAWISVFVHGMIVKEWKMCGDKKKLAQHERFKWCKLYFRHVHSVTSR